jgi:hypothetical protein
LPEAESVYSTSTTRLGLDLDYVDVPPSVFRELYCVRL